MKLIDVDAMKADLQTVDHKYEKMVQWCIMELDAQPKIKVNTGKWISCGERLPGKGEDVLITNNWHEVRMAYLTDRTRGKVLCWIVDHNSYHPVDRNEILAWMELPNPFFESTLEEGEAE